MGESLFSILPVSIPILEDGTPDFSNFSANGKGEHKAIQAERRESYTFNRAPDFIMLEKQDNGTLDNFLYAFKLQDLDNSLQESTLGLITYELTQVIVNTGGHYIMYGLQEDNTWKCFDDQRTMNKGGGVDVGHQRQAKALLYSRRINPGS